MTAAGRPLRVLEVAASLAMGGAERVALELAAGLPAPEFRAELLCAGPAALAPAGFEREREAEAARRGVRVHRVELRSPADCAGRRRLAAFLADGGWDVVHVHNRPQDWQVAILCRLLGVPAVYTLHLPYDRPSPRQLLVRAAAGRAARAVVCVSRAVADHSVPRERVPRSKVRVIHNGIRTDLFRPAAPEARRAKRAELGLGERDVAWLCAARLSDQKGHRFLLEAFARLPAASRSLLLLAGDGELRGPLEAQAAAAGLGGRVRFLGARADVPALLGAADGYCTTTLQEGHPLSILEAMAAGLPVVAPRLAAIEEIAFPGNPLLFGPEIVGWARGHDPSLAAAALRAVEDDLGGHAARAVALHQRIAALYAPAAMIAAHAALYRDVAGGAPSRLARAVLARV